METRPSFGAASAEVTTVYVSTSPSSSFTLTTVPTATTSAATGVASTADSRIAFTSASRASARACSSSRFSAAARSSSSAVRSARASSSSSRSSSIRARKRRASSSSWRRPGAVRCTRSVIGRTLLRGSGEYTAHLPRWSISAAEPGNGWDGALVGGDGGEGGLARPLGVERLGALVVQPTGAVGAQRLERRQRGAPLRGQLVLDAGRDLGVLRARQHLLLGQLAQARGQEPRAHARELRELREAPRTIGEVDDEQQGP